MPHLYVRLYGIVNILDLLLGKIVFTSQMRINGYHFSILLQSSVKLFNHSADVASVEVKAKKGQEKQYKIKHPEINKKVSLRPFDIYITNQRIANFELIVDIDIVTPFVVINDLMDVLFI